MDWAINIFIILLMTDLTGTIFFLVGQIIRKFVDDDVAFLRFLTEATLLAYLVPFVYIILYLNKRIFIIKVESGINLFYATPLTLKVTAVLGWVWIGLFLLLLAYRLYRAMRWRYVCRGNIPEEDELVFKVFTDICARFGIEGKVSLYWNDSVKVPCVTHYHGYVIILPLVHYTEKEAEVILCHELCHYLNRDLFLKKISCLVALLHVFNPAVHILMRQMDMICERGCDRAASKKGEDRFTRQEYFQVILESLVDDGKKDWFQLFALSDDKSNYERRIEYMKRYHVKGGLKRGSAIVLAACFLLGSSITSLAAGDGVMNAYAGLADSSSIWSVTEECGENNEIFEVMEELAKEYDIDPESIVIMDDGIMPLSDDDGWNITWTIPAGRTYMTSGFHEDKGNEVAISMSTSPNDIEYRFGLKDPDNILWYLEDVDKAGTTLVIGQKGRHYFFVKNMDEERDLHVNATLYI